MSKRKRWYKHKSKGLGTKHGGPCKTLSVNWWKGTPAVDVRLREKTKQ